MAEHLAPLPAEEVRRQEALGRCLAEDLSASVHVPAEDVSAMDGYAVAGEREPGEPWPVLGVVAAGDPPGAEIRPGTAMRVMTGAPVPRGSEQVIPVEDTDGGRETVQLRRLGEPGNHIRRRGEVLRAGQTLLPAGSLLTPGALSLVAGHGVEKLRVHGAPRVAVLTTGDELVPPEQAPSPGQIRDTNTSFLLAAGASLGLSFVSLGIAPDRLDETRERIAHGLEHDVLLLCGGVSMGEFDYVERALDELGCHSLFSSVAIQPGKPLVAAVHERSRGGLVFGLPGNPASVMVTFWLFARPALRRLLGCGDGYWSGALSGELVGPLPAAHGRDRFLPAEVTFEAGALRVLPLLSKGSHDLAAYGRGTALVRVVADSPPRPAGDRCEVLPLCDWRSTGPHR